MNDYKFFSLKISEMEESHYQKICDFFNRNGKYLPEDGSDIQSIDLQKSFLLKDVLEVYFLELEGRIIAMSSILKYTQPFIPVTTGIYSGFYLIDIKYRNTEVPREFSKEEIAGALSGQGGAFPFGPRYSQISIHNRIGASIRKHNGIADCEATILDALHYKTQVTELPDFINSFYISESVIGGETLLKLLSRVKSSHSDEGFFFAAKTSDISISAKIARNMPSEFTINDNEFKIAATGGGTVLSYLLGDGLFGGARWIDAGNGRAPVDIGSGEGVIDLGGEHSAHISLQDASGAILFSLHMENEVLASYPENITFDIKDGFFSSIEFDYRTGSLYYLKDGERVLEDTFMQFCYEEGYRFDIRFDGHSAMILYRSENFEIEKRLEIGAAMGVTYTVKKAEAAKAVCFGVNMIHQNFWVLEDGAFRQPLPFYESDLFFDRLHTDVSKVYILEDFRLGYEVVSGQKSSDQLYFTPLFISDLRAGETFCYSVRFFHVPHMEGLSEEYEFGISAISSPDEPKQAAMPQFRKVRFYLTNDAPRFLYHRLYHRQRVDIEYDLERSDDHVVLSFENRDSGYAYTEAEFKTGMQGELFVSISALGNYVKLEDKAPLLEAKGTMSIYNRTTGNLFEVRASAPSYISVYKDGNKLRFRVVWECRPNEKPYLAITRKT